MYLNLHNYSIGLGMNYVMPPSVSGWSAYYQTPEYYRLWINASLINARTDYATRLNLLGGIVVDEPHLQVNHLEFLSSLSKPADVECVVNDMLLVFCPKKHQIETHHSLEGILLQGKTRHEWKEAYSVYESNTVIPSSSHVEYLQAGISRVLDAIFRLPDFQTM